MPDKTRDVVKLVDFTIKARRDLTALVLDVRSMYLTNVMLLVVCFSCTTAPEHITSPQT